MKLLAKQNNGLVKGDGGAVGLTENPPALRRWMVDGPEMARLVKEFQDSTGYLILVFSCFLITGTSAIHCLQCDRVSDLAECTEFVACQPDEACYTEKYLSLSTLLPEYRSGCRNVHECKLIHYNKDIFGRMASLGHRRATAGLVICTECCFNDSCNLEGCGGHFIKKRDTHVHCFSCNDMHENETCHTVQQCQSNEMCTTTKHVGVGYDLGCGDKHMCNILHTMELAGRKLDSKCCSTDLCNTNPFVPKHNISHIGGLEHVECYVGTSTVSPETSTTTHCQSNEMCFASTEMYNGIQLRHLTKCMNNKICTALMNATFHMFDATFSHSVGRRYTDTICAVCCGDDLCNKYECEPLKERLRRLYEHGLLDVHTLKEITPA